MDLKSKITISEDEVDDYYEEDEDFDCDCECEDCHFCCPECNSCLLDD